MIWAVSMVCRVRAWAKPDGGHIDQLRKIVDDLSKGLMIVVRS